MRKTFENTAHFIVLAFVIIFIAVLSPVSSIKSNAQGENLEGLCTVDQNTTSTQFTIHYDVNDGSVDGKIKGTVKDATFPYYPQVKISSVILKATGYKFLGWAYEADAETPNFKAGETLNPDDNRLYELGDATVKDKITLYAVWESAASYTLNVYKEPKKKLTGETEHLSYSLLYGESVDLKGVFEKPDYVLNGFKDDKNKTYKVGELKNLTSKDGSVFNLYADWKAASYKIVYKDSLETLSGTFKNSNKTKSFTVETKTFALSKPSRTGYKFEGWEVSALDSKRKLDNEGSVVTSIEKGKYHQDIVLTAKWSFNARKVEYRIMVKEGNLVSDKTEALRNAFVNGNISTFTNSKTVTLKNPSIKGYSFKGWFNDPECTAKSANIKKSSTLSADPVVKYALFTENTYKIIVNGNNISGDKKVIAGIKYTDVLNTSDFATSAGIPWKYDSNSQLGLRFFSTKSNGKGTNFGASEDVTALTDKNNGTVTLYAVWDAYKITYVDSLADFGSSIMKNNTSNPGVFTPGTSAKNRYIKLVKPTKAGYTFISWECDKVGAVSVNGKGEYQIDRGMIDPCDITLTANWAPNTYTLYLYPNASDAELEVEGNYSSVSDSTKKGKCISLSVAYDGNTYTCNGAAISDLNEINYVRPGYTFKEWNTKSNGKGTAYSTGKALNLVSKTNSSAFLYAIWTKSAPDRVTGIRIGADNTLYFNEQNDVNGYEVQLGKKLTGVSRGTITEVASSGSTKVHGTSEKMYVR
ncbi:MAG: InlB B-repeat-containing protein, partial [Lachnospiraceae bacterium]|nr:InlB B-repeat-containing protein [Lachnospiraceae bacterium]